MAPQTLPQRLLLLFKLLTAIAVLSLISACGGQSPQLPQDPTGSDPVLFTAPPPPNPYLSTSMIGQTWTMTTSDGSCTTWVTLQQPPPSNYYPAGSIDMFITKSGINCYPAPGVAASIHYILSPLSDGSFHSMGWVWEFTSAPPQWCPFVHCSQQVQPLAGYPMPYMAIPAPGMSGTLIFQTFYLVWFYNGENYNAFDSGAPWNTVPWKTVFTIDPVTGVLTVEAFEGQCGHEISHYTSQGLVDLSYPNDASPGCIANLPSTSLHRI